MREIMIACVSCLALASAASADTRAVTGFNTVNASGRFDVSVTVGDRYEVNVTGADAARIRTRVEGETLKIEPARRPWFGNPRYDARIAVTVPQLSGVAAARGAEVEARAGGECTEFGAAAAMGAVLSVTDLTCRAVEVASAMGAQVTMSGECDTLQVAAAMGGAVDAEALRCRQVDATAAMGGAVEAFATQSYDASASMGGDINIGGGATGDRTTAMGGSVTSRN
jgi:hypothetical protein